MLQKAAPNPDDLDDLFNRHSPISLSAYNDSLDCNDGEGEYPQTAEGRMRAEDEEPTEEEKLQAELLVDAQAIARIVHSKHTPALLRSRLFEALDEIRIADDAPEVIRVAYPLAVMRLQETEGRAPEAAPQ
jgi:hypothetical protein